MKEQLQIEHIAPYLPYKPLAMVDYSYYKYISVGSSELKNELCISIIMECKDVKLALHPLSDFTKEIEHDGKRFVPNLDSDFKYFINHELEMFVDSLPYSASYAEIQKLHQWHFDTDGLIEKGLAIDVNTLDVNPYK